MNNINTRITRLEDQFRNQPAQNLVTVDSPDFHVAFPSNLSANPNTVATSLNYAGAPGGTYRTVVTWITPHLTDVDRYEIWGRNSANVDQARLLGAYKDSPAVLSFPETVAGTMVLYLLTVMKNGKRNNLLSCPTTTCKVTV